MITIRQEHIGDAEQIRQVNTRAFGQAAEADIVDALRKTCPDGKSFVAESEGKVVGHILFTPVVIESNAKEIWGMGLAPLSVLPEFQRQGIGSRLIQAGLDEMRKAQQPYVIVLGHPDYYPRFGFKRASEYGIASQYDNVPEEAFMILRLDEGYSKTFQELQNTEQSLIRRCNRSISARRTSMLKLETSACTLFVLGWISPQVRGAWLLVL